MAQETASNYPGGSKSRVNRAGDAIRKHTATAEDLDVIETWRAAHRGVLNTFQALLRNRSRGKNVIVAQRHKRANTIFNKLDRLPQMALARMDDIAGCRLIFRNEDDLRAFRASLHGAHFAHKLRNEPDKYDYIKQPKPTGYRGIHDVYEYDVASLAGKHLKGLYIELQYRTAIQHAWATAVEMIGVISDNHPKFEQGDKRYQEIMTYTSEILARAHEGQKSCHPTLSDEEVVRRFLALDDELGLMATLRGLNAKSSDGTKYQNMILIIRPDTPVEVRPYRDATDAMRELFKLERQFPAFDIVLVRAESSEEVRIAFRNYFTDAREFIRLVEKGCEKLMGEKVIADNRHARIVRPARGAK